MDEKKLVCPFCQGTETSEKDPSGQSGTKYGFPASFFYCRKHGFTPATIEEWIKYRRNTFGHTNK